MSVGQAAVAFAPTDAQVFARLFVHRAISLEHAARGGALAEKALAVALRRQPVAHGVARVTQDIVALQTVIAQPRDVQDVLHGDILRPPRLALVFQRQHARRQHGRASVGAINDNRPAKHRVQRPKRNRRGELIPLNVAVGVTAQERVAHGHLSPCVGRLARVGAVAEQAIGRVVRRFHFTALVPAIHQQRGPCCVACEQVNRAPDRVVAERLVRCNLDARDGIQRKQPAAVGGAVAAPAGWQQRTDGSQRQGQGVSHGRNFTLLTRFSGPVSVVALSWRRQGP